MNQLHARKALITKCKQAFESAITEEWICSLRTQKGNTQSVERMIISRKKEILDSLGLKYSEAGSQQSKDFRNIHDPSNPEINFDLEVKKADSLHIFFNDTCPCKEIEYAIYFTGKTYKKKASIPAQLIWVNGGVFLKDTEEWLDDYKRDIEYLKNKYGRGENKKKLRGILSVYPRPTYQADISSLICSCEKIKNMN